MEILMQRRIYPFLLMVVSLIGILSFQIRQFKRLYEHIKNDKYDSATIKENFSLNIKKLIMWFRLFVPVGYCWFKNNH